MANVAIIGRGWGARVQQPAFQEAGLRVSGPAGRDGWEDLVTAPGVDLVSVLMPPSLHLEISSAALRAGKHVICEKPTAMNETEAEELLALARAHPGQIGIIDHELRFLPAWQAARERVAQLGGVRLIEVRYASPGRADRNREWNWWSDASHGGGIWGAVGSHFVDTIRFLGLEVEAAQALLHTVIKERPFQGKTREVTSDDFAAVNLQLSGGAAAALTIIAVATGQDEPATTTIHCERAALRLTGEELLEAEPMKPYRRIAGGDLQKRPGNSPGGAFGTGTLLLGQALKRALDDGDRHALGVAATFEDGLAQQRVLDAARRSHANGGCWERVTSA